MDRSKLRERVIGHKISLGWLLMQEDMKKYTNNWLPSKDTNINSTESSVPVFGTNICAKESVTKRFYETTVA